MSPVGVGAVASLGEHPSRLEDGGSPGMLVTLAGLALSLVTGCSMIGWG
jgi:hypothetical protein